MKRTTILLVFICLLSVLVVGCGETYDIQTDTEFHAAADTAIEQCLKGEENFDQLYENFSDRYDAEEMDEFVLGIYEEREAELAAQIDTLNQAVEEQLAREDEFLAKLDGINDITVYENLIKGIEQSETRIDELKKELDNTEDYYRMIEILEEVVELYKETYASI